MFKFNTKNIIALGLLTALEIVLTRIVPPLSTWNMKITFGFIAVAVAAFIYGPVGGAIVGGLADFIGAILFPLGAYFPGFTLTAALTGALFGLCFYKKCTPVKIAIAVLINQLVFGLLMNSYFISVLYGANFQALLSTRIVQAGILIPLQFAVIYFINKGLIQAIKKEVASEENIVTLK